MATFTRCLSTTLSEHLNSQIPCGAPTQNYTGLLHSIVATTGLVKNWLACQYAIYGYTHFLYSHKCQFSQACALYCSMHGWAVAIDSEKPATPALHVLKVREHYSQDQPS